ncbi:MAG: hypothetical protein CL840_20705 [Crocinitomicaceae bacterium]|nr:hypothetical protein [Crocinitomicaceae bacterium]|tara:strand:- start:10486 stop:10884 length:399 start_codon:yes stop_codon:yes gene_type:complete
MARRFLIFGIGFLLGCVLVYVTMFKGTDREFYGSWLPEGRVLKKIKFSLDQSSSGYKCILEKSGVFDSEFEQLLESGDIDFEKSSTDKTVKRYFISSEVDESRTIVTEIALRRDSAWITQIGISTLSHSACD